MSGVGDLVARSQGEGPAYELPPELVIDTAVARRIAVDFIRGQLRQAGFERLVLGLSGGIDSALVAYLAAEAVGPERLLCVLMPYRTSAPESRRDAEAVVARLGCPSRVVEITAMVEGYFGPPQVAATAGAAEAPGRTGAGGAAEAPGRTDAAAEAAFQRRQGNFMARVRMAVLYDLSAEWSALVVGTSNKTEALIGYTTIYGDNACALNPIGDLYKTQVRQLAEAVGVPPAIVRKAPSADLWPGQTDESEVGFEYADVDRLLYWLIDRRRSEEELVSLGFEPSFTARVARMVAGAEFKRQVPPVAKISSRTTGVDYLYPRRRPGSGRHPG